MDYYTKEEVDKMLQVFELRVMENIMKTLPFIVRSMVVSAGQRKELADKFYDENKDLKKHKELVMGVIEDTESKNPGDSYEVLLKKSLPEIRRRLTLTDKVDHSKPSRPCLEDIDSSLNGML